VLPVPLDLVQAGIIVHQADSQILYANVTAQEMLGVAPGSARGAEDSEPHWVFVGADLLPLAQEDYPVQRALRAGAIVRDILIGHLRPSDGSRVWLLCTACPVADDTGAVVQVVVSVTDVTRLKETERALRLSDERMQLVLTASTDAIWDIDLVHGTYFFSPRWWEMLGYGADDRPAEPSAWMTLLHADDLAAVTERLATLLASDETRYELDSRMLHKSGQAVLVRSRGYVLRDSEGRAMRLSGTNTDLTERQALEQRLHQAEKMQGIGQLAGGVAHDFNNLLAVILGNLELLQPSLAPDSEEATLLHEALVSAQRGADLTKRLLMFARQQPLDTAVVPVEPVVHGVTALLKRLIGESVTVQTGAIDAALHVRVDPTLFGTALLNLAINARDAMPRGGTLEITATRCVLPGGGPREHLDVAPGAYVHLAVRDTGTGMREEVRQRALEPFFTTKPTGRGTGLGLSMVYGFVTQSAGALTIASALGRGTTVHLYLPVSGDEPTAATAAARVLDTADDSGSAVTPSGVMVLVIEDEPLVRRTLVRGLRSMGYGVIEAANGPLGVQAFQQAVRVDIVLTDVVMPDGMAGPDVAAAIHRLAPQVPVVFMTGYSADILDDLIGSTEYFFLAKPYRLEDLRRVLREALAGR